MGPSDITIDISAVLVKELVVKGSFRYGVRSFLSYYFSFENRFAVARRLSVGYCSCRSRQDRLEAVSFASVSFCANPLSRVDNTLY